jgi:hypothetical protein
MRIPASSGRLSAKPRDNPFSTMLVDAPKLRVLAVTAVVVLVELV